MSQSSDSDRLGLSVIVPVCGEKAKPRLLVEELLPALRALGSSFEIVLVVDGKDHSAGAEVRELIVEHPAEVLAWRLKRVGGEAGALAVGFDKARGQTIVTMSSQPQTEPSAVGTLVARLESSSVDIVVGRRYPRKDGLLPRIQTWMFHRLVRFMTGTEFRDLSCGTRALTSDVAQSLRLFGKFHRFVPVLAQNQGFRVEEVEVPHSLHDRPPALYGPTSYLRRLIDVLTVFFLVRFTRRPLRFFGTVGLALFLPGLVLTGYLGVYRLLGIGGIADRPLLLLAVLLLVAGIQILSVGLLGELIIFTYAREQRDYRVEEVFEVETTSSSTRRDQLVD